MAVNVSPFGPKPQFELADGTPAIGNQLFFYVAGSVNTKQNTYTDSTGGVANANPIVLNALGEPTNEIWFTAGLSYKVVYAPANDTDPPTSPIWTIDNLVGINDVTATQDQWVAFPGAPTFVGAASFTLAGDQTTDFHPGRRLKSTNSGGTIYSTIITSTFAAVTTIVVANDSGVLDSGLSAVSYSLISATNQSVSPEMVYRKSGAAVASAGTTNIWGITGDFVHITGTTPITSLGTAPYAGDSRTIIFDDVLTLTHHSTTLVLPGGANITTAAGDRMVVRADTTANMIVTQYTPAAYPPNRPVLGTEQASTSGTSIDFTIPSWVKSVLVQFVGVSTNGTSDWLIQLGDPTVETTGYLGAGSTSGAVSIATSNYTAGFGIVRQPAATTTAHGHVRLSLEDAANFTWACSGVLAASEAANMFFSAGSKSTSAAMSVVRITTANGTDAFDAGAINVLYQ